MTLHLCEQELISSKYHTLDPPSLTCCHPRPPGERTYSRIPGRFIVCTVLELQGWSLCAQKWSLLHLKSDFVWTQWNFSVHIQTCSSNYCALKLLVWETSPTNLTKRIGKKNLALNNGTIFKYPVRKILVLSSHVLDSSHFPNSYVCSCET